MIYKYALPSYRKDTTRSTNIDVFSRIMNQIYKHLLERVGV
jgi:hypothetical protein